VLSGRCWTPWAGSFLVSQARLGRMTFYTETNTVLARRTGVREFDFDLDGERHAMSELLGQFSVWGANTLSPGLTCDVLSQPTFSCRAPYLLLPRASGITDEDTGGLSRVHGRSM
jgi:hypothetical protein